jgi:hypothetical protein
MCGQEGASEPVVTGFRRLIVYLGGVQKIRADSTVKRKRTQRNARGMKPRASSTYKMLTEGSAMSEDYSTQGF